MLSDCTLLTHNPISLLKKMLRRVWGRLTLFNKGTGIVGPKRRTNDTPVQHNYTAGQDGVLSTAVKHHCCNTKLASYRLFESFVMVVGVPTKMLGGDTKTWGHQLHPTVLTEHILVSTPEPLPELHTTLINSHFHSPGKSAASTIVSHDCDHMCYLRPVSTLACTAQVLC